MLPLEWVDAAGRGGWTEPHPIAAMGVAPPTAVMIYAPRDEGELAVVESLISVSYACARGGGQQRSVRGDR
jgi:hypothetical protein